MPSQTTTLARRRPNNVENWTQRQTRTLRVEHAPTGALNLNVDGRQVVSPLQGFGQMWQKTYTVMLHNILVTPETVIHAWKNHFGEFWPARSRFFGSLTGIKPDEIAVLNLDVGGMPLSTGVLVLYADDESFTLMTPQGHMFAGLITFSAFVKDGTTYAQAQVLLRASDPLYELGLRFGGHKQEDIFWQQTLSSLAHYFQVQQPWVTTEAICLDKRLQWSYAKNIRHNSALHTLFHTLITPSRWFRRRSKQRK